MEIVFTEPKPPAESVLVQAPPTQEKLKKKPKDEVKFKSDATRRTELETFARPEKLAPMQAPVEAGGQQGSAKKANQKRKQDLADSGTFEPEDDREELRLPGFGSTSSRPLIPAYVQQQMPPGVQIRSSRFIEDEGVYRHGAALVEGSTNQEALRHFIQFIETVSAHLRTDHGDVIVSNLDQQ